MEASVRDAPASIGPSQWLLAVPIALLLATGYAGELSPSLSSAGGLLWRVGAVLLLIRCLVAGVNWQLARNFLLIFAPWLIGVVALTVIYVGDDPNALGDLLRQTFLVLVGATIYGAADRRGLSEVIGRTLMAFAIVTAVACAFFALPLMLGGWSYDAGRNLKAAAFEAGFGANAVCFAGLIAAIAANPPGRNNRLICWVLVVALALESLVLTSRAPVFALAIGGIGSWWLSKREFWGVFERSTPRSLLLAALVLALPLLIFLPSVGAIARSDMARELAGRAALWQIGLDSWSNHMLYGTGVHTFTEVIRSNLGSADFSTPWERAAAYSLEGGGFHNIWINILTERGLIGFIGMFGSYALIFAAALQRMSSLSVRRRILLLMILSFVFLRGYVEIAGLFAYGDAPLDMIVIITLACGLAPSSAGTRARRRVRAPAQPSLGQKTVPDAH